MWLAYKNICVYGVDYHFQYIYELANEMKYRETYLILIDSKEKTQG